ncbi:MAG: ketoacyl-ACP synthase III [Chlorobi bacterium]|nr:ketoacyl-ACP synthase III [Chlorobiota bacterium]
MSAPRARILGTGSYIPPLEVKNEDFLDWTFYDKNGPIDKSNEEIIRKFYEITHIKSRRFADDRTLTSDMAAEAARKALEDAGIDKEQLDYIIVGSNYGDVEPGSLYPDFVPSIAARVKYKLQIENPAAVAFDIIFGCPGWLEGVIQAHLQMKAGVSRYALVIGAETLSRVRDPYSRDSMIFADGAGATVLELTDDPGAGILSHLTHSYSYPQAELLQNKPSLNPDHDRSKKYIFMEGHKIYEFALNHVPAAMKACFDRSGEDIRDLKKIFIHQANEKMDRAIVKRFFRLYNMPVPEGIMPTNIEFMGNSSVATIPTLMDQVRKGQIPGQELRRGDLILLASVGAGMHINAVTMRF